MTASPRHRVPAFLHRLGLLAGMLAIVAGILGMHVMTGHATHAAASPAVATGHAHSSHSPTTHAPPPDHSQPDPCSSGTCPTMQTMAAECMPSPKTESLAAPLPGRGFLATAPRGGLAAAAAGPYGYTPPAASPGELSISRT